MATSGSSSYSHIVHINMYVYMSIFVILKHVCKYLEIHPCNQIELNNKSNQDQDQQWVVHKQKENRKKKLKY